MDKKAIIISMVTCVAMLVLLFVYQGNGSSAYKKIDKNIEAVIEAQTKDLNDFEAQLSEYTNPFAIPTDGVFDKRVYINGTLHYWSTSTYMPAYTAIRSVEGCLDVLQTEIGYFLVMKRVIESKNLVEIFSFFPLQYIPTVSNQYLQSTLNDEIFGRYKVQLGHGEHSLEHQGRELVRLDVVEGNDLYAEVAVVLISLLLTILLIAWVRGIKKEKPMATRYGWYIVTLIVARAGIYVVSRSFLDSWDLFDPIYFTGGFFFPSLGDFLLNALCVFVVVLLPYSPLSSHQFSGFGRQAVVVGAVLNVSVLLAFAAFFYLTGLLLDNSQIVLDIARSIHLDGLRLAGFLTVLILGLSLGLFFALARSWMHKVNQSAAMGLLVSLVVGAAISIALEGDFWMPVLLAVVSWNVLPLLKLQYTLQPLRYSTFIYFALVFSSVSLTSALAIYKHNEKDTIVAKSKFGDRLLIHNDILGEYYLGKIMTEITEDRYIRTRLLSKLLVRQNVREKIKRQYLTDYFNKYDVKVHLFGSDGKSFDEGAAMDTYKKWQIEYQKPAFDTDYPGLYLQVHEGTARKRYLAFLEIGSYGTRVGYIVLDLTLKKYIPQNVFPELLVEVAYEDNVHGFDYGVFRNGELVNKQGNFSFENSLMLSDFVDESLYKEGFEKDGYHFYGVKTSDGRVIVVVSRNYQLKDIMSNFSFYLLLMMAAGGLLFWVYSLLRQRGRLNLSAKIQLYLGLSFIPPMVIVSIALINSLNSSYKDEIDINIQKRSYHLAENLVEVTSDYGNAKINIDELSSHVMAASDLAQTDINIYNHLGHLVTSSQPGIFNEGLLSHLLDPKAYYELKYGGEQNVILAEQIGTLDFKTSYTSIRSYDNGRLLGILAIPYFNSKNHLRRQQIDVFNGLLVVFTMIFLLSILAGNYIVEQIVKPLRRISERLSRTSLEVANQPIAYESRDEIGALVKEYNLMLVKLEESKAALARSQKESAWKEIARQVAHEIKNPLTPMQLKIQQMMRKYDRQSKEYEVFQALLVQVESLSTIADSFSEFAKMPAPENRSIELIQLLDRTISLYQGDDVTVFRKFDMESAMVYLDPKIFTRAVTNLILNAIQATEGHPVITVKAYSAGSKVVVSIKDNGKGIASEDRDNIFTPYFSTKEHGSGIGLAVVKKGIENAGGNIWFETEDGQGTTFYISLPIHQP